MLARQENFGEVHDKENGMHGVDHAHYASAAQRKLDDHGGNPLAHINTGESARLPAFGGEFQPGLYKAPDHRKFGNPAPLGLCGFALTTFLLSLINLSTDGLTAPNIVIGPAFAYGGLCQLLAGLWEIAVGNTFGGTALTSYGGFWIGTAIILTPGGFQIEKSLTVGGDATPFLTSFSLYLFGWFIFTVLMTILTLKSTVAFFTMFFMVDLAFLSLALAYYYPSAGAPQSGLLKAGGVFGILAAFLAWYNALAGMADPSNSFFIIRVVHFPWSEKGREARGKLKTDSDVAV